MMAHHADLHEARSRHEAAVRAGRLRRNRSELAAGPHGRMKAAVTSGMAYELKITLLQTHPLVWRRLVTLDCTFDVLHEVLRRVMGWSEEHPYWFVIGDQRCADPQVVPGLHGAEHVASVTLSQIPRFGHSSVYYEYDLGDSWRHKVDIESSLPVYDHLEYPLCVAGERACPPEECGGAWGYRNLVESVRDGHDGEASDLTAGGRAFDPEAFSLAEANNALRRLTLR